MSKKLASELIADIEWYINDCTILNLVDVHNSIFAENISILDVTDDFNTEGVWGDETN